MNISELINYLQSNGSNGFMFLEKIRANPDLTISKIQKMIINNPQVPIRDLLTLNRIQQKVKLRVTDAENLVFTDKGAEQCSTSLISAYHASKLKEYNTMADLCCGNGIDLIAMAKDKKRTFAIDLDDDTLLVAAFNCKQSDCNNVKFLKQRAEDFEGEVEVIFADPDRRADDRRVIDAEGISPTLSSLLALKHITPNMMIKLSPAMNYKSLKIDLPHTWEFVSQNGNLKEILLCTGKLATSGVKRKAVLLPSGDALFSSDVKVDEQALGAYLLEPDPALVRGHLVAELAKIVSYGFIDKHIALLTGTEPKNTPFAKLYRVGDNFHYNLKFLKKYLRENDVGELVIKTRGFAETVEQFRKKLKLKGSRKKIMFIIRVNDTHRVIFVELE